MAPIIVPFMSAISQLLCDIEAFTQKRGIAETTFGLQAVNDGKFVARVRRGGKVTTETVERVMNFIQADAPRPGRKMADA